jgi:hypothetical protein
MKWLKSNIGFILQIITLSGLALAFLADFIPMPARAADLDKLAGTVQQMADTYQKDKKDHKIKDLQKEIDNIKLQHIIAGKQLSAEANFYIEQRQTEINNIRASE